MLHVPVVHLDRDLPLPGYAHDGDAGMDLRSTIDALVPSGGGRVLIPTGIAVAIPSGFAGFVVPRSGLALRHGVSAANSPGLIDSGYRDELKVILINTDPSADYEIARGERIAQLVVQRVEHVVWRVVDALDDAADRGGGFGHSGRR